MPMGSGGLDANGVYLFGESDFEGLASDILNRPAESISVLLAALTTALNTHRRHRNRVINGAFRVNQRGYVSAGSLASGAYGFDRWAANAASTTCTYTSAPQGQLVTINSAHGLKQTIERADMPAGSYVLSWSGTATGRVYNVGATPPAYAASPVTVTLDGTADVVVEFTASGGNRTLGLVQLEAGSTPTPFERLAYRDELALCERYFQRIRSTTSGTRFAFGSQPSTTAFECVMHLPTRLRTVPTVTYSNLSWTDVSGFTQPITGLGVVGAGSSATDLGHVQLIGTMSAAGAATRPGALASNNATHYLDLSAEF